MSVPSVAMTRRIGFLVFPDFQILDLAGPLAAFEIAAQPKQTARQRRGRISCMSFRSREV